MRNFESTPSHIDSHGPGGRRKEIEEFARPAPNVEDAGPRRDVGRDNRFADRCCIFRPRALANLPPPNFLVEHAGGASDRPSSHLISRRRDGLKSLFPRLVGVRPEGVRVSVVVTVKNDPRVIDCAERVLSQDASFPFELVIVDNGSTNDTPQLLRDRFANNPRVTILSSGGNLSEAWNHAAATARGQVLVRIDADAIPLPGWLTALATPILDGQADWTAGPVGGASPHGSLVERYYHHRTEAYSRRLAQDADLRDAVPSWNVAYSRAILEAAGWYDPWQASSVDWDLHKRLKRFGGHGQFVPGARALHHHPTTLTEFARKEAWYRTGQYQMVLKYGIREMRTAFELPFAYAFLGLILIASIFWPPLVWAAASLLIVLLVTHWIDGVREDDPLWPYRALFRPIEGFAGLYGILRGVVRYGIRRPART